MKAKIVLPIAISILLFSLVSGTRFVEKGVEVTNAVNSGQGFPSGLGESSVDWWPMFHHDLNHTGYSTSKAPKDNNTLWSYTTSGGVQSSPAVSDGRVYVGSEDSKVYCLNASTGSLIWSYTTGNLVWSSPAVSDGRVYVGSYDSKVYAFGSHDVAITSATLSTTEPYPRQTVDITVVAKNDGTFNETFDVSTYYDSTLIGAQTVTDLPPEEEKTLIFSWNTTNIAGGYYAISANASIVTGETDIADNTFTDGTVKITSPLNTREVIPCNKTGNPEDAFELGVIAFFKVTINSTAAEARDTLITINLFDNLSMTIGVASFQAPIMPGISTLIFGLPIPATATIGTATVYACAYTDWPSQGGFPHCPEMSATLEITGP